jgi:hypothetical protein
MVGALLHGSGSLSLPVGIRVSTAKHTAAVADRASESSPAPRTVLCRPVRNPPREWEILQAFLDFANCAEVCRASLAWAHLSGGNKPIEGLWPGDSLHPLDSPPYRTRSNSEAFDSKTACFDAF